MSLLSIVASSSAFLLPASPPPKGSSIDSDWSIRNKKQPGFLRLISAWYAMVSLHFWHHDLALQQQPPCQRHVFPAPVGEKTFHGVSEPGCSSVRCEDPWVLPDGNGKRQWASGGKQ